MVTPLSNKDILSKCQKYGVNIKFVLYRDLKYVEKINDILPCILLYELHEKVGHWVCLWRNRYGINYFDPTGRTPDRLLINHFQNENGRRLLNADYTYLNRLLYLSKEDITYNSDMLQPDDSMTCGYWCAVRMIYRDVQNDEFNKHFLKYNEAMRERKIVKLYNIL
jgi:hypothetical protein